MKMLRAHAIRRVALAVLAGAFAAACSTLLGVDDLPPIPRVDGGDAGPSGDAAPPLAGSLDPSFGDRGLTTIEAPLPLTAVLLFADGDELVVVATNQGGATLEIFRCSADGICDIAHSKKVPVDPSARVLPILAPNGNGVLVHTRTTTNSVVDEYLLLVHKDGSIERLRYERTDVQVDRNETDMVANSSRIVLVESRQGDDAGSSVEVRAFLQDGGVDSRFGTNGHTTVRRDTWNAGQCFTVVQPDGSIVILVQDTGGTLIHWVRLDANGRWDTSFGLDSGIRGLDLPTSARALVANDGGYTAAGSRYDARGTVFRIALDGGIDPAYWDAGVFRFPSFRSFEELSVVGVTNAVYQPSGGLIVLGTARRLAEADMGVIARLLPDGLDRTFGREGIAIVASSVSFQARSLAIQANGKPVVAWSDRDGTIRLVRYLTE